MRTPEEMATKDNTVKTRTTPREKVQEETGIQEEQKILEDTDIKEVSTTTKDKDVATMR